MVRERFVIDRKRITTGGSLPTLDLMLELIRHAHGYSLALEVSRLFIYEQERTRGDLLQVPAIGNMRILETRRRRVKLMEETVEAPLTLSRAGARVWVSARHLQDLFKETMGVAPHEHYGAAAERARRKVIETRMEFADIAAISGFNSRRLHFRQLPRALSRKPQRRARRSS